MQLFGLFSSVLVLLSSIAAIVFWLMAIYTAITSKSDTIQRHRGIWIVIAFTSLGMTSAAVFFAASQDIKGKFAFWVSLSTFIVAIGLATLSINSFLTQF